MTYSVLSATAKLGIAAEDATAEYAAPAFTVPFAAGTRFRDMITQLHDRTVRARDTDEQDIQQGHYYSDWTVAAAAYPDWAGWLFRAMIGPDQYTPGTVTAFAQAASPGAKSFYLAAAPPAGSVLQIGTGSSTEYVQAGTPTGTGPYLVPIASPSYGLRIAHPAGDPAQSQASHLFQQDRPPVSGWPTYSLTTDDGVDVLGWPGCTLSRLRLQVTAGGYAKLGGDWNGWPPVTTATFTEAQSDAQPSGGWEWGITTAGGASARGITLDLSLTRPLDISRCLGQQSPYVIAPGPMRSSGTYKALYDTPADLNLYRQAIQEPAVWTLAQPLLQGGCTLAVTQSLSGWTQGTVSLEEEFVVADYRLSGIANTADSASYGTASVTLANWVQGAYGP